MSNTGAASRKTPHKGLQTLLVGLLLYVSITLYKSGLWLIIYDGGTARNSLSEVIAIMRCLFASRPLIAAFEVAACAYFAHCFLRETFKWPAHLTAFLVSAGSILGQAYATHEALRVRQMDWLILAILAVILAGLYLMTRCLISVAQELGIYLSKIQIPTTNLASIIQKFERHPFICSWITIFTSWMPTAFIKYPGGLGYDAYFQIEEYFGFAPLAHKYWPVASSVFMGAMVDLGHKLFGSLDAGLFCLTLVQAAACSAILAYSLSAGKELQIPRRWRCFMLFLYSIAPIYYSQCTSIIKDMIYTCLVVLLIVLLARNLFKDHFSMIDYGCLTFTSFLVCIFRSNGISIILLGLLVLLIHNLFSTPKRWPLCWALMGATGLFCAYSWFISHAIDLPKDGIKEGLSLPFQQTAHYVKEYGHEVTAQEREAINAVLDYEALPSIYDCLLSNNVKATYRGDSNKLPAYFKIWIAQFLRHPAAYLESPVANTGGFFYVDAESMWTCSDPGNWNKLIYTYEPSVFFVRLKALCLNATECLARMPLFNLINSVATSIFITLGLALECLRQKNWKMLFLLLPSIMGILTCVASPTFYNGGIRYAFPIVYALPFLWGLYLKEKLQRSVVS